MNYTTASDLKWLLRKQVILMYYFFINSLAGSNTS